MGTNIRLYSQCYFYQKTVNVQLGIFLNRSHHLEPLFSLLHFYFEGYAVFGLDDNKEKTENIQQIEQTIMEEHRYE